MAFYISTNGQLHPYSFHYLEGGVKNRLEKTKIHSDVNKSETSTISERSTSFFAIDVMSTSLITATPESSLQEVKELMKKFQMHHIPMVRNYKLIGLISDRDLLKIDMAATFYFLKAQNIMTTILTVCDEETPLSHIAKVLLEEKISCLPVIDKDLKLTGIISRTDLLKVIIENRLLF